MKLCNLISYEKYSYFLKSEIFQDLIEIELLFHKYGFSFYVVGGFVRSILVENSYLNKDIDITTSAKPEETLSILEEFKLIAQRKKISIWKVGIKYGTIGLDIEDRKYEITTYRGEKYDELTRKPIVVYGDSLQEDLIRRDFTINTMVLSIKNQEVIDYCGGIKDLKRKTLNTPQDALISFKDDPLRILRCARFQSILGFNIDRRLYNAAKRASVYMYKISSERIAHELEKILIGDYIEDAFEFLKKSGVLKIILPEIYKLTEIRIKKTHLHKNVYIHTLKTVKNAKQYLYKEDSPVKDFIRRRAVLYAALFHDVGKFETKVEHEDGSVTFHNHNIVSAEQAVHRMNKLRLSKNTITIANKLIKLHLRQYNYCNASWSDSAIRRYMYDTTDVMDELFILINADNTGNSRTSRELSKTYKELKNRIEDVKKKDKLIALRPEMNGEEIMQHLKIQPSKTVGILYKYLLEVRIEQGLIGKEKIKQLLLDKYELIKKKIN